MYRVFLKRIFDLVALAMLVPIVLPVGAIVALILSLHLGRPVLFRQLRAGYQSKPFVLLKFRTMTADRDEHGSFLPDENRLTGLGIFLRRLSLDELPQLWNVLKGDMSLVGPRPLLVEYVARYTAEQARRHETRPGITGWTQVNGRNALDWDQKFRLDVWYVDHCSFWLDVLILLKTIAAIFERKGISQQGHATMPVFTGSDHADCSR